MSALVARNDDAVALTTNATNLAGTYIIRSESRIVLWESPQRIACSVNGKCYHATSGLLWTQFGCLSQRRGKNDR